MRFFSFLVTGFLIISISGWETNFENAKKKATEEHKLILLNFSGSDWCIPCIKFHKQVLENSFFINYADSNLVLFNADFPRLKKNQLSKDLQTKNDKLADQYNPTGIFPYTLLLTADGKIIKTWEGFPNLTPEQFTRQIKNLANVRN